MDVVERLAEIRGRVGEACRQAGRSADDVCIIGVTKYGDVDAARSVLAAGCVDLGESRPQAMWYKAKALAEVEPTPRWHLIGHLQRNKVRRTLEVVHLIHTLDSQRLLATLADEAAQQGRVCEALIEVNLAGDPGRTGADEAEARAMVVGALASPHIRLRGLMGMASIPGGADPSGQARRQFADLRELRDRLRSESSAAMLTELSMGMSGDYFEAILEGATMVRIGSALFE
jgi:pyridoxal phosphate enzyme (YggS family)